MTDFNTLHARVRDRLSREWFTPSQARVWDSIKRFSGPPHRVINIYGVEGTGKTFLGWVFEREKYATYGKWPFNDQVVLPRLCLDDAPSDRFNSRALRPLVDKLGIQQIILLTRVRVDELSMPVFELRLNQEDLDRFRANYFRYLKLTIPEGNYGNLHIALNELNQE